MIEIADLAVLAAVERSIGHQPPFSETEVRQVTKLTVLHASDLSVLQQCGGLTTLDLVGCNTRTLNDVAALTHLSTLHVLGCPVEDAAALTGHPSLEELHIDFCFVQDLSPLTEIDGLRRGRFVGNPFDPASWHELRPAWRRTRTTTTGQVRLLEFGPVEAWESTRVMWEHQVRLSFGVLDGIRPTLVRPGIARIEGATLDSCEAVGVGLIVAAERGDTTEQIFQSYYDFARSGGAEAPSDFSIHRMPGDADDARSWAVQTAIPEERDLLLEFIAHFPDCDFFHEDAVIYAAIAAQSGVPVPAHLAHARTVLAGALPDSEARFRLSNFSGDSPRAGRNRDIWYYPNPGSYSTAERKELFLGEAQLFPLAEWIETGDSILAVRIANDDEAIYEFSEKDLYDAKAEERPISDSIYRVFASYAELLAHIGAYQFADQNIVAAAPDSETGP